MIHRAVPVCHLLPVALSQMLALLKQPWTPRDHSFRLDEYAFYLALLSPNVGRIAVRDWMALSIESMRNSLLWFLQGTQIASPKGDRVAAVSLAAIVEALDSKSADLTRGLLRTAYAGTPPPSTLLPGAGQRLNYWIAHEKSLKEKLLKRKGLDRKGAEEDYKRRLMALASAVKLGLYWHTQEAETMIEVNPLHTSVAYHSGRLLAALDRAQRNYMHEQSGVWPETTGVLRSYAGACVTPATVIGQLYKTATTAHLPKASLRLKQMVEDISSTISDLGGWVEPLDPRGQAEFGLGFYQQRALMRSPKPSSTTNDPQKADDDNQQSGGHGG